MPSKVRKLERGPSSFSGVFEYVELNFCDTTRVDIIGEKNNKTVAETLIHHKYAKLKPETLERYPGALSQLLGAFLLQLKHEKDPFYKRFLNKYGDLEYSTFKIADSAFLNRTGVYTYFLEDELKYIGRCKDSMRGRINQGYGTIHPKNCYIDGQATNCHLNSMITPVRKNISLWLHSIDTIPEIERIEKLLIREFSPPWNIQRG